MSAIDRNYDEFPEDYAWSLALSKAKSNRILKLKTLRIIERGNQSIYGPQRSARRPRPKIGYKDECGNWRGYPVEILSAFLG